MADTLVIVESPAKAKTIGKFLGSKYKVVASNGHVRDLPKSTLGVDPDKNFAPKYITLRGRGEVLETIRREAKDAKNILLATDPDREGEAISWHLAKILDLDVQKKCRIEFNEITANAVKSSIKKPRTINMNLVDAQQARRVLDRLVGYKISPILWHKVQKGLSAGRVQSVATRIICDREEEINEFVPEEYWTITAKLDGSKTFEARYFGEDGKKRDIHTEAEANEVKARTLGASFRTVECKTTEKRKHAPAPFTTSGLQQDASRKLGFTTKRTMMIAQQLYEGVELGKRGPVGMISYIRTDSVRVASEAQQSARQYIADTFGQTYVPQSPNIYRGRRGAQDAHEAIRPTDLGNDPKSVKPYLSSEQYKLYKLIFDRFVASQMSEAVQMVTSCTFDANGATFKSSGTRTMFDGYTAVYTESKEDDEKEVTLPKLAEGDVFKASAIDTQQKFTQPPARYTEASLVHTLEEKGIGRPSTYAPTISTVIDRGYVAREKKLLVPTDLGFIVTNLMKKSFPDIVDIAFTANMEEELDEVEEGKMDWTQLMSEFYAPFIKTVQKADSEIEKVNIPDEVSDVVCELCGAQMVYKNGRYGRFLACPNYPTCKNTKPIIEKLDVPCPKCGGSILKRRSKKGHTFYGCENYPTCDFTSWNPLVNQKCPKCGGYMVQKRGRNGTFVACADPQCAYIFREKKKDDE
ncbi:MAG: type I DNA topoisomerase [Clostridia bacterium]|nr:type I DNA topoisomerase [Clostridia bacterium]